MPLPISSGGDDRPAETEAGRFRAEHSPAAENVNPEPLAADPSNEMSGLMRAAAAEIMGHGATIIEGLKAHFAARIMGARQSGASKAEIAATIQAIKQEQQAAISAAAERTSSEVMGRIAALMIEQRDRLKAPPRKSARRLER